MIQLHCSICEKDKDIYLFCKSERERQYQHRCCKCISDARKDLKKPAQRSGWAWRGKGHARIHLGKIS